MGLSYPIFRLPNYPQATGTRPKKVFLISIIRCWVVYLRIADKYLGPLASRLSGVNQPGIST
jgi:hypothetical protein